MSLFHLKKKWQFRIASSYNFMKKTLRNGKITWASLKFMKCFQHFYLGGAFFGVTDLKSYFRPAFLQMKSLVTIYIYKGAYE